ncbi:dipeptidyl-peptidase 3 family protein [Mangrovibacterium marinum]|uniref:Dipeptidyl-peptidase-3 n=1 Tax=Mangrovibacterium marinum TaxID=1639118 RepID=A0A2T5C4S1_9BACT|nr:dihydrofolate reductase [Mangrovibacterium marinum]PTN09849.1 dipeptidyl-peptidase-3 [Mangrovibacterium marinum]
MSVFVEKFADIKILRYQLPGFEQLSLKQKQYIYYLSQAALCGRDILFDQNGRWNLKIRSLLEAIYQSYRGDRDTATFKAFHLYLKRVWFGNGIHHHYSTDKFSPGLSRDEFTALMEASDLSSFPFVGELEQLLEVIFNPEIAAKRISLDSSCDLLKASAMNYYQGVDQQEAEAFYEAKRKAAGKQAPSFGLNSTLIKENGELKEDVWCVTGKYGKAIQQIVFWLEKAVEFAENEQQKQVIEKLVAYYRDGDLTLFDDYSIAWTNENEGLVDFVNGFIEIYGDPLGIKASWEAIVNYKDVQGTKRALVLSENAGWFEANSPVDARYKKEKVKGVSAKVIHVAMLGGDCYPATPIGINLPNSEWIREEFGSKSVTIENITQAYFQDSLGNGMLEEFAATDEEIKRARAYGQLAGNLHTDLHECLGHGSGRMMPGVKPEDLKNYYSTIEETRADLFALYYIADPKLQKLGLVPSSETGKAEYDAYLRNGLITQLTRIEPGKDLEESHMRNRQLIAKWAYEHGKADGVVALVERDGKTYVQINDYGKLRDLFGELLNEVQRIKSEGDFQAAKALVEEYGVKIDLELHKQVLSRFKKLDIAPYAGFLNPELRLVKNETGETVDVEVIYQSDYTAQMLAYSQKYGFLANS